ncbi:hypothetical protein [Brevibacillus centrosporus]
MQGVSRMYPWLCVKGSGARVMVTLLHELERTGKRFGLQALCEGNGQR